MNIMPLRYLFLILIIGNIALADFFEKWDAKWGSRWWSKSGNGYSLTVEREGSKADFSYLTIKGSGNGYGLIQSKRPLYDYMESLKEVPDGFVFWVRGGQEGQEFELEIYSNMKCKVPLGYENWTRVKVLFSEFAKVTSYESLRESKFVQIVLKGANEKSFDLGPIGWSFPKKYDSGQSEYLLLANFRTKALEEYMPTLKVYKKVGIEIGEKYDRNAGYTYIKSLSNAYESWFAFEVNGAFDEGGCPDWKQAQAVILRLESIKNCNLAIEFSSDVDRKKTFKSISKAYFEVLKGKNEIRIPESSFDRGFVGGIQGCRLILPEGGDIKLFEVSVEVPRGMYKDEMARRISKRQGYYGWRIKVLESKGLKSERMISLSEKIAELLDKGKFEECDEICGEFDAGYAAGLKLLALKAMSKANYDRAKFCGSDILLDKIQTVNEDITLLTDIFAKSKKLDFSDKLDEVYSQANSIANSTIAQMRINGAKPYAKGRDFYTPWGENLNYYGPHAFQASRPNMVRNSDLEPMYQRIAAMGYNAIRLEFLLTRYMPQRYEVNEEYLRPIQKSLMTAWKYGLWVQFDNHFYMPSWVWDGPEGWTNKKKATRVNAYQNLEDYLYIWTSVAKDFKEFNNIFVFETPMNEHMFYSANSITDYPYLMHQWNMFLKKKYESISELNKAWSENSVAEDANKLSAKEDWDDDSIMPPGFTYSEFTDEKNQNARVWDWLMFSKWLHADGTRQIADAVHKVIPDANFMLQYIVGDIWDKSPVKIDYKTLCQVRSDESIFMGSHYGVSGKQVLKAIAMGTPSTDSENQAESNYSVYLKQKYLNSGITVFADYGRWGGGMLWGNDEADYKPSTQFVPLIADFMVNAQPLFEFPVPQIAVIEPTRLRATMQNDSVNAVLWNLGDENIPYHLFEEHYVIDNPDVLANYEGVIVNLTFANTELLDILKAFDGEVMLFGDPSVDSYCKAYPSGITGWFVSNGVFLKDYANAEVSNADTAGNTFSLNLEGEVKFKYDRAGVAEKENWQSLSFDDSNWEKKTVPAYWGELEIIGSRKYFIGDGWYRFKCVIPESWKDKKIVLEMGSVDDTDEAYINGMIFGKTTKSTPNWWQVKRIYELPNDKVNFGRENVIAIKVNNSLDDSGIYKSPVALFTNDLKYCEFIDNAGFFEAGEKVSVVPAGNLFMPNKDRLTDTSVILAKMDDKAVVLKDFNFIYYGLFNRITDNQVSKKAILSFVAGCGVDVQYPHKKNIKLLPYTENYYLIAGDPYEDGEIAIEGSVYETIADGSVKFAGRRGDEIIFTVPKDSLSLVRVK